MTLLNPVRKGNISSHLLLSLCLLPQFAYICGDPKRVDCGNVLPLNLKWGRRSEQECGRKIFPLLTFLFSAWLSYFLAKLIIRVQVCIHDIDL